MKKILLFCIVALFCGNAMAQSKITGSAVTIEQKGTATLDLSIEGTQLAAIAQVSLKFPENISIAKNDKGKYKYTLGELCNEGHSATVKDKKDGSVLVLVQNNDGDPFEEISGVLISLPLEAAEGATLGDVEIQMSGIVIGTNDSPSVKLNTETEGTIKVTVTEATGINALNAEDSNEPVFNLAGQKVSKNYKGVIVKNGKKAVLK